MTGRPLKFNYVMKHAQYMYNIIARLAFPEVYKAAAIRCARKYRKLALDHYGGKCACCGESRFEFLSIDHINGGGTKHREEIGRGTAMYQWLRRSGWPSGFRVLCHNCNQAIGFYKHCPHQLEKIESE